MIIRPLPMPDTDTPIAIDGTMPIHRYLSDFRMFTTLRRMLSQSQARPLMKRIDFMQQVTLYLPEVAALIEERDFGVLHQEVGALRFATQQALRQLDFTRVRRHLSLLGNMFEHADAELHEAIKTSYLEALFLGETSSAHLEARSMLSKPMEQALRQAELRYGILQYLRSQPV